MQEQKQRHFQCLCWKPIASDPLYHPHVKAKGTFRPDPLHSLEAHKPQCWSLQGPLCSAASCRANPDFQAGSRLQKPRPRCLVLCPGSQQLDRRRWEQHRVPRPAQPGWRQSTAAVPQQAGEARLTPLECRQSLCILLSTPRMKPPSELLQFGEGASAVAPPPSPVGSQPRAARTERYAVWDTWSIS